MHDAEAMMTAEEAEEHVLYPIDALGEADEEGEAGETDPRDSEETLPPREPGHGEAASPPEREDAGAGPVETPRGGAPTILHQECEVYTLRGAVSTSFLTLEQA